MVIEGKDKQRSPGREQTDESLRVEREKTDLALAQKQAAVEDDADDIVSRAREAADAVVVAAREKADRRLDQTSPHLAGRAAITAERARDDETLRDERAGADESLRLERDATARALTSLLPLERDTTDRYLLSERIRADDAVSNRDDFLGIVSHDLRDLLGGVVVAAGLLAKRAPDSEEGLETLKVTERIQRYAARMNRLIGDLVDVASIDAGKLSVAPVRGDAALLISEAVDTFHAASSGKGLSLEAEIMEMPLLAEFDPYRMLQVFANLITNSMKFTPEGGSISVSGEQSGDVIRFCVRDSGMGMPEHALEAIFERFRQVADNDRRGLGLGLYISRCIVEAHGGKIWAESRVGEGSRIFFTLPSIGDRRRIDEDLRPDIS